jgi:formate hydrogenlyase subunit 6/NADH:ubiquinone oxidoreductase subunit I
VKGRMAEVTYSKCIRCFCCHEVCPEDAIVLRSIKSG